MRPPGQADNGPNQEQQIESYCIVIADIRCHAGIGCFYYRSNQLTRKSDQNLGCPDNRLIISQETSRSLHKGLFIES